MSSGTSPSKPQYTIQIDRTVEKTLRKQPRNLAARLVKAIDGDQLLIIVLEIGSRGGIYRNY